MNEVITIGVDLAKNVFQVHGVDAEGSVIVRRQLRRGQMLPFFKKQPPCLVGMEACATSHHWGREIEALGHHVRLMPPRRKSGSFSLLSKTAFLGQTIGGENGPAVRAGPSRNPDFWWVPSSPAA
jgi:hypothetical protein